MKSYDFPIYTTQPRILVKAPAPADKCFFVSDSKLHSYFVNIWIMERHLQLKSNISMIFCDSLSVYFQNFGWTTGIQYSLNWCRATAGSHRRSTWEMVGNFLMYQTAVFLSAISWMIAYRESALIIGKPHTIDWAGWSPRFCPRPHSRRGWWM